MNEHERTPQNTAKAQAGAPTGRDRLRRAYAGSGASARRDSTQARPTNEELGRALLRQARGEEGQGE